MIEQISTPVKFVAFYTANKTGTTGLTVTVDVYSPAGTQIVTGGSATAIGGGLYSYTLSTNNSTEGEYAAIFKTTDSTVDSQHIPSLWVLGRAGVENLDAAVSTRLATSGYTAPSAVPTVTAIRQEMDSNSTKLANLDATVSSRLATSGYTAPSTAPTVAAIRAEMDSNSTKLANLDATVSSRLASSAYSAAPTAAQIATAVESSLLNEADGQAVLNAIVGAIGNTNVSEVSLVAAIRTDLERTGGKLDSIPTTSAPTAAANATAVWSAATKTITGGTVDTLTNSPSVPSAASIASATRSELATELGRLDAAVSTRLATSGYTAPSTAPTAAANASAVRTELASELAKVAALNTDRLANVATTAIVGNLIAQANS